MNGDAKERVIEYMHDNFSAHDLLEIARDFDYIDGNDGEFSDLSCKTIRDWIYDVDDVPEFVDSILDINATSVDDEIRWNGVCFEVTNDYELHGEAVSRINEIADRLIRDSRAFEGANSFDSDFLELLAEAKNS